MTETEARQFLTKYLKPFGYDVQRNESGAINEGFPDLTVSKDKKSIDVELKQGHLTRSGVTVEKWQSRQKGKLVTLSFTRTIRVLVVLPDKSAFMLSAPYVKFKPSARAVRWITTLDQNCDLVEYLGLVWEDLK